MFREPRDKPHRPKTVRKAMEHLKIDPAAIVTHAEWKPPAPVGIDKAAGRTLLLLHHRIPVICLKIVPEKALSKLYSKVFKFRKRQKKRLMQKLRLHRLL